MTWKLILALVVGFCISSAVGAVLVPYLRKIKAGQAIREDGPTWHMSKQGTPTMGGLMFIAAVTIVCLTVGFPSMLEGDYGHIVCLALALVFGAIGFLDDYEKLKKKQNLGLTPGQKLIVQFLVAFLYLWSLFASGDRSTVLLIPFWGQLSFAPWLYYPLCAIGIVYFVNSVNLTDGLDGLAASVTAVAGIGFFAVAAVLSMLQIQLFALAVSAGCIAFLIYNFYPAKVFMGDTGSMFLGGCVVALAFGVGAPMLLGLIGIIYLCESLSVVIQVISFKTTGKRIFKMSPIHHHFEMSGYTEVQIGFAFSLITALGSILAFFAARGF